MNKCFALSVAGLLGEKVVLDWSLPLNTGDGVEGGVSTVAPIAIGDALSDRTKAATHAFGLEAMSIGCEWGVVAFFVAVAGIVTTVAASLVADKLLLPNGLAPPSSSTLAAEVE